MATVPSYIRTDVGGVIEAVNDTAATVLGRSQRELVGRSLLKLLTPASCAEAEPGADRRHAPQDHRTAARRSAFLAHVSGLLARAFDYERALASAASYALPMLGTWCMVDSLEDSGGVRRLATVSSTGTSQQMNAMRALVPAFRDEQNVIAGVLRGDPSRLLAPMSPDRLDRLAATPEHRALLHEIAPASGIVVPCAHADRCWGRSRFS